MAVAPYLVPCLVQLRSQFNWEFPTRAKGADGWIGDNAHATENPTSDHNPDIKGRVRAIDITTDLNRPGVSLWDVCEMLRQRQASGADNRLEYIIHMGKIASRSHGWTWRTYTGTSDPHTGHAHLSARHDGTGYTNEHPWGLEDIVTKSEFLAWFEEGMDNWANNPNMTGHSTNLDTGVRSTVKRSLAGTLDALVAVDLQGDPAHSETSLIGRNTFNQGIPNPIQGGKTSAYELLSDIAAAVKPTPPTS